MGINPELHSIGKNSDCGTTIYSEVIIRSAEFTTLSFSGRQIPTCPEKDASTLEAPALVDNCPSVILAIFRKYFEPIHHSSDILLDYLSMVFKRCTLLAPAG